MTQDDLNARASTVSPEECAHRLGIRVSTLSNMRWTGRGPTYIKVGGRVRYRLVDIAEYLNSHARSSTSERTHLSTRNGERAAEEV